MKSAFVGEWTTI